MNFANITTEENTTKIEDKPEENKIEVENKTKKGQKCSINLVSISGKEEFYEKCGFHKIPYDYTGYGMKKKIQK